MEYDQLTATYICEHKERLEMALHVYKAMPTVRHYLIKDIFREAEKRVATTIDGVELWKEARESVYFWTKETEDFYVFASTWRWRGQSRLVAGVYVDEPTSIKSEHRERFKAEVDPESWSDLERSFRSDRNVQYMAAFVRPEDGGGRWDDDDFLTRAILKRNDVVSDVEDLLKRIYEGMFPLYRKSDVESSI